MQYQGSYCDSNIKSNVDFLLKHWPHDLLLNYLLLSMLGSEPCSDNSWNTSSHDQGTWWLVVGSEHSWAHVSSMSPPLQTHGNTWIIENTLMVKINLIWDWSKQNFSYENINISKFQNDIIFLYFIHLRQWCFTLLVFGFFNRALMDLIKTKCVVFSFSIKRTFTTGCSALVDFEIQSG